MVAFWGKRRAQLQFMDSGTILIRFIWGSCTTSLNESNIGEVANCQWTPVNTTTAVAYTFAAHSKWTIICKYVAVLMILKINWHVIGG